MVQIQKRYFKSREEKSYFLEDCNYSCDYCSNSRIFNYYELMQKGDYLL